MKSRILSVLILGLMTIGMLASLVAAQPAGASTTEGAESSWSGTEVSSSDIEGGNVSEVNVSGFSQTGRWAGFWGEVSGGIRLADASANTFYEWTVTDVTDAVVYAVDGTVSNWNNMAAASNTDMPAFLTASASDNYTNTFTTSEAFTNPDSSINIAGTNYAQTWSNGAQGNLKTYSLIDGDDSDLIWAGKAIADETSFDGGTVDYQILVPADSTPVSYNFYLELP